MTRRDPPDPGLDAQLSALLDGALDAETAAKLRADPDAAARLADLERGDALIAEVFAEQLDDPPPQALLDVLAPAPAAQTDTGRVDAASAPRIGRRRPARQAAALAFAAGIGALAALGVQTWQTRTSTPGWILQVADYHRVYSAEDRHLVELPASEADRITSWLGKRVGPFEIPDFSGAGLEFRGARLLAAVGKPVAQLVYINAAGDVVALCITPRPGAADADPTSRELGDLAAMDWRNGEQAFIVVGPADGPALAPLAERVRGEA